MNEKDIHNRNNLERIQNCILKINSFILYTICFAAIAIFMGIIFLKYHKGYIWISDGLSQHYVILRYFRNLLLNFINTGNLQTFTWTIGLGADMFANLAYYIFGDFISYFSIFFPESSIKILYCVFVVIRMYFIGFFFMLYTKYKKYNKVASIIGAIVYSFCGYVLFASVRHPYFINAIAIFPLLMLATDRIIEKDKKGMFIIVVALMYIVSFYFAYMMSLCIGVYVVIVCFNRYKKGAIKRIFIISAMAIVGILLSCFILFPTAYQFINGNRSGTETIYSYSIEYYRNLINAFTGYSGAYWVKLGINGIFLVALPLALKRFKRNKEIILFFIVLLVPLLISQLGSIFDGFSYPNNRWSYVISFIDSIFIVELIQNYKEIKAKDLRIPIIVITIYFIIMLLIDKSISAVGMVSLISAFLVLILFATKDKLKIFVEKVEIFKILMLFLIILTSCATIYYFYDVDGNNYIKDFISINSAEKYYANNMGDISYFEEAVKYIKEFDDENYYRIAKSSENLQNSGLYYNYNTIHKYYSINSVLENKLGLDLSNINYLITRPLRKL